MIYSFIVKDQMRWLLKNNPDNLWLTLALTLISNRVYTHSSASFVRQFPPTQRERHPLVRQDRHRSEAGGSRSLASAATGRATALAAVRGGHGCRVGLRLGEEPLWRRRRRREGEPAASDESADRAAEQQEARRALWATNRLRFPCMCGVAWSAVVFDGVVVSFDEKDRRASV